MRPTQPADNVGAVGYKLYKGNTEVATTDPPSYLFDGKCNRAHSFSVSAVDAAGNDSARSAPTTIHLSGSSIRNQ